VLTNHELKRLFGEVAVYPHGHRSVSEVGPTHS
jgi:hypothetical protein